MQKAYLHREIGTCSLTPLKVPLGTQCERSPGHGHQHRRLPTASVAEPRQGTEVVRGDRSVHPRQRRFLL